MNAVNEKGCVPLLHCALEGLLKVAEVILKKGGSPSPLAGIAYNSKTDQNMVLTPVDAAVVNGENEILKLLLQAGANVATPGVPFKGEEVTFTSKDCKLPLIHAAMYGNHDAMKMLIDHGADALCFDETTDISSMMYACETGNTDLALYLMKRCVDMDATMRKDD